MKQQDPNGNGGDPNRLFLPESSEAERTTWQEVVVFCAFLLTVIAVVWIIAA